MQHCWARLSLVLICICVWQGRASAEDEPAQSDFESFPQHWRVDGVIDAPLYSFYLGPPAVDGVAYLPNFSPRIGPRVFYHDATLTATFPIPIPDVEKDRRGVSYQSSFIFSPMNRQIGFDVYYQQYKGFYEDSPWTEFRSDKPDHYPQLPDATINNYGVTGYYVLSPEHYSLAAAFNQSEFQKITGGSWLLSGFFNHLDLDVGSTFIPGSDPGAKQSPPVLPSGTFSTLGAGGGYGYSWIRGRRFVSAQGIVGVGAQYQDVGRSDGTSSIGLSAAVKLNATISAGYNYQTYLTGAKFLVDSLESSVKNVQVASTVFNFQIFFGRRF